MTWSVIVEPQPPDPRRSDEQYNSGGVVVQLTDGSTKSLVGRVAYVRWRSKNPLRSFKRQFQIVLERAEAEAEELNTFEAEPTTYS